MDHRGETMPIKRKEPSDALVAVMRREAVKRADDTDPDPGELNVYEEAVNRL